MALTDNMTSYYKLDDLTDSHGSNTLTNVNTVTFVSGKSGLGNAATGGDPNSTKHLYHGDTNSPVGISLSQMQTAWSMSAWIKEDSRDVAGANAVSIQCANGTQRTTMQLRSINGVLNFVIYDGASNLYATSQTLTDDTWYHVVWGYNGSNMLVYVNASNVLTQSRSISQANDAHSGAMAILANRENGNAGTYWSGLVDELGVWTRFISTDEITELYNSGDGLQYPFVFSSFVPKMTIF